MKWNKWPHWQKGGVIGVGIYVTLTLILILFGVSGGEPRIPYWTLTSLPAGLLIGDIDSPVAILLSLLLYFLIGGFIGLIIGKVKSRKN